MSLIPASWSTFSTRWIARVRSLICALRSRVRSRSRRISGGGTKLGRTRPCCDQLADPLRVLDVGLAPGDVAQVLSIQQPALEAILKHLEHRLPIHAGGLHPDQRDRERRQPLRQLQEPRQPSL